MTRLHVLGGSRRRVPLLLAALLCIAACHRADRAPEPSRPNVLLITVDTLRADHLGIYGYPLDTAPFIGRLASLGVRFADVTVQWPKTWPALASMLTGTYPATNGIRFEPRRPLPEANVTMAEIFKAAGYASGAVVANVNVGKDFAFDQGFDEFVESWVDEVVRQTGRDKFQNAPGKVKRFTNATIVTDQAIVLLDRLGKDRSKPFLLWLHYIDPHGPYLPPQSYCGLFEGEHRVEHVGLKYLPQYQWQPDPRTGMVSNDAGFYRAQYDREVRYLDDQLSRLWAAVEKSDLRERTLVILTADHGESLGEQGYYLEHGALPYQSTAHVPLIMALEGVLPAGRVVDAPVGLINLLPTILDVAGLPQPPGLQGGSLLPLLQGRSGAAPAHVFMESGYAEETQLVTRQGAWKLVQFRSEAEARARGRALELFDVRRDPGERHNVAADHPQVVQEMRFALQTWLESTPKFGEPETRFDVEKLDERTKEMMRALGYLD